MTTKHILTRRELLKMTAGSASIALLTGCALPQAPAQQGAAPRQEVVVLDYWDEWGEPDDLAIWDPIFEEFNERHQGRIRVDVRHIPDAEFFTALRTGVTGGNPPDVFQHESGLQLKELIDADAVMPLGDWWEERKDRWQSGTADGVTYNGTVYATPIRGAIRDLLAWNTGILDQHNLTPPETWDEFLATGESLKESGVVPLAIGNQRGWPGGHLWQTIALRIAGAEKQMRAMRRDGVHWTDPDFILASELYAELSQRDFLSPGYSVDGFPEGMAYFLGGNSGFFHPFSHNLAGWEDFPSDWDRFPQFPDLRRPYADPWDLFAVWIDAISVSSQTEHPEEAFTLLEYLVSPEVQSQWIQNANLTPMRDVLDPEQISPDLARFQEILSQGQNTIGFIVLEVPAAVSRQVFDVGALAVWTGQQSPQEWMEAMEIAHADLTNTEAVLNP